MPLTGHPLVPTRRQATVVDIIDSTGVGIVLGGDDPADTSKWVYASYLADYPPLIGDTIIDLEHDGDHFVLGAPSWVGSGRIVGLVNGPASQTDYSTPATVVTMSVPVVSGRNYRVGGNASGSQQTSTGLATVIVLVNSGDPAGGPVRPIGGGLAVASGTGLYGYAAGIWTAPSTASATFSITAQSSAGAFRISANAVQLAVEDVGV